MSAGATDFVSLRRVVLALEGRVAETYVVEAAVSTASVAAAELHSVFVEDEELLGAAALPVALEISRDSGALHPLDAANLEHRLRAEARAAEQQIAAAAQRAGVTSSFHVTRRDVAGALGELASASDVLVLAPAALQRGLAATISEPRGEELVVFDGSDAGVRALNVAAIRAARERRQLTVGLSGESPAGLRKQAAAEVARSVAGSQPTYLTLDSNATEELLRLIRARRPAEVVLPTNAELLSPRALGVMSQGLHCMALLVR